MCLLIEVLLPDVPAPAAGRLTRAAAEAGLLELLAQRQPRGAGGARFLVGEPHQGCACSLLGDEADWDAPFYALRPGAVNPLAQTLAFLREHAGPAGMYVRGTWLSGALEPLGETSQPAAGSDLFKDLRAARLASSRVYRVRPLIP